MQFEAVLPGCEIGSDPLLIRDGARVAEELGCSHIIACDHVLGAEGSDRSVPLLDPRIDTAHASSPHRPSVAGSRA